jgi:hypothetical protein
MKTKETNALERDHHHNIKEGNKKNVLHPLF